MRQAKKHMTKKGFRWFTLCGVVTKDNNQPTSDLRQVTCEKCLELARKSGLDAQFVKRKCKNE